MESRKNYDFEELSEFFNKVESPSELADDVLQVVFNYVAMYNDDWNTLGNDIGTLQLIYEQLKKIKPK